MDEILFQYGRYLLVSCSRPGKLSESTFSSEKGIACRLHTNVPVTIRNRGKKIKAKKIEKGIITFPTEEAQEYLIVREDK
jgi:hypothetical protein